MLKRVLTLALVILLSGWNMHNLPETYSGKLRITEKSKLSIEGSSNVNEFTCNCLTDFPPIPFEISWEDKSGLLRSFRNTQISLPIANLDCGNKMMNKDLRQALNADKYPFITINLVQSLENDCTSWQRLNSWVQLKALVEIELNGCTNSYWLPVMASRQGENSYRFISNKDLKMTDFGVQPPTALLGMVKVNNEIKISLDLVIDVIDYY